MNLRFRVWDTRDQRMLMVRELYFNNEGVSAVRVIGNVSTSQYKKTDFLRMPRGIVMQWTGIHDRKGTEIYEGDIVEFRTVTGKTSPNRVIERMVMEMFNGYNVAIGKGTVLKEVIGNIYATPGLIEHSK